MIFTYQLTVIDDLPQILTEMHTFFLSKILEFKKNCCIGFVHYRLPTTTCIYIKCTMRDEVVNVKSE